MKSIVGFVAIASGILAAVFWAISARVKVMEDPSGGVPWQNASIAVDGVDLVPTLYKQAKWNRWASTASVVAILAQTIHASI